MSRTSSPGVAVRTARQLAYVLVSLVIAVPTAVVVLGLATVGILLSPLVGGFAIMQGAGTVATVAAAGERRLQARLLGRTIEPPARVGPRVLSDRQTWLELVWAILRGLVAVVTAGVVIAWLGLVLALPITAAEIVLPSLYPGHWFKFGTWDPSAGTMHIVQALVGLVALVLLPWVVGPMSRVQSDFGAALLGEDGELARRVDELSASRAAGRQAEADQLRRLERDLHDGPQQRLVRLQLDLTRAQRQLTTNPERAAEILDDARTQADQTLQELRQLGRRVAPPLLAERGLGAAATELAGHSTIPASVAVDVPRLPEHVETAVYYVMAEAMANANKHSGAQRIDVAARMVDDAVVVRVRDDGHGGADAAKGHGLRGLQERLAGVDGRLIIDSPRGGPTQVEAVVPCAS
ncbi:sensor histidine kinase [Luteococcus sp. OSA5]|uniref:sensor histidine kinase n=1 Tax=Luteococcus sp. OSA5 TaxID=3401630 RepID=UPI003B4287E3